jgi:two-component system copper resistance phosphate regulon response regulator CusR
MHILVIEDEQRVAELIKKGLEELEFHITLVFDGEMGKKLALTKTTI